MQPSRAGRELSVPWANASSFGASDAAVCDCLIRRFVDPNCSIQEYFSHDAPKSVDLRLLHN